MSNYNRYKRVNNRKFPIWEVTGETDTHVKFKLIGDRYIWVLEKENTMFIERRKNGKLRFEQLVKDGNKLILLSSIPKKFL
jgi:hypothetical protein